MSIDWSKIEWGDAATWTNAGITAIALVFAFFAARATWRQLKIEQRRDKERDQAAEREQADRIAVWHGFERIRDIPSGHAAAPIMGNRTWCAMVENASTLPVYDAEITFLGIDGVVLGVASMPVVPPGRTWRRTPASARGEELTPSTIDPETGVVGAETRTRDIKDTQVAIDFRDSAGRTWRRDIFGVLTRTGTWAVMKAPPPHEALDADAAAPPDASA